MDQFSAIGLPRIPRNRFDLSHDVKLSFKIGQLVPTCVIDCIPGGSYEIGPENLIRFSPLIAPIMHRVDAHTHFFFVPYRILWPGFEDFITGTNDFPAPYVTLDETQFFPAGSQGDYLGIPPIAPLTGVEIRVSPFYFAAYRKIYDEYYRDQNLMAETFATLVNGDNTSEYGPNGSWPNLFYRSLKHDYFTSALPFAQKGDPVTLPLTFANDIPISLGPTGGQPGFWKDAATLNPANFGTIIHSAGPTPYFGSAKVDSGAGETTVVYDPNGTLSVDIQSQAVTLETLRTAIVLQEFLERDARSGTRYTEKLQGQYGVRSSDKRLQRPEYVGGISQVISISEVLSTAQSSNDPGDATQFVGQMAGHGVSYGGGGRFRVFTEEHGCIIGITSIRPRAAYMQGIHRMFTKFDVYDDYAWPAFANLGEQAIRNQEIYVQTSSPSGDWGYQGRYAEYKSMPSRVAGEFRTSLSQWHMAFDFSSMPSLSDQFLWATPDKYDRVFAVASSEADHIYAHVFNHITASLPLPRYGIPQFGSTGMGG